MLMELEIEKLKKIYKTYGFEIDAENDKAICFVYRKSRYFGVDIIPLDPTEETMRTLSELRTEYSNSGFAADIRLITNTENAETELYKSFFSYESSINRLKKKYDAFVRKQTKALLGSQYQYIESPHEIFNGRVASAEGSLLSNIMGILKNKGPQLIIIEAAAGYGKTCAAYEVLNRIVSTQTEHTTPLFTELSKNRAAKIFRYILLDEIDSEFPTLNSDLVIHEIKNGRIPLIIDGFDELLEKVNISDTDLTRSFEEIETMLDTIGNLLESNAKIILTTRKTAIFTGIEFDNWYQKWAGKFHVSRISLKEPKIKDWLGMERYEALKNKGIPIQYVANPVLLTYLKNLNTADFAIQLQQPELLIDQYFNRLLERERDRQNLIITVDKQREIFKNVVVLLLEFDITVETKDFFKDLIKDQNTKLLEYTRTLYSGADRPSVENLVDTLCTHALLDRKGRDENQIGFINDFVLGIFIGEIICETPVEKIEKDYSYYMLDLGCTAYKVQNLSNKAKLWAKVNAVTHKLQPISVFTYDVALKESLQRNYDGLTVYDITFFHIEFKAFQIQNTVFLNCYFRGCIFDISIFTGVSFIDCTFDQCVVTGGAYLDASKEIATIKCELKDCEILLNYEYHTTGDPSIFNEVEIKIMASLMSISLSKAHHIMQLVQRFPKGESKKVLKSLEGLELRGFLELRGNHIYLTMNKIQTIKTELGIA